jgi:hypothetical protein
VAAADGIAPEGSWGAAAGRSHHGVHQEQSCLRHGQLRRLGPEEAGYLCHPDLFLHGKVPIEAAGVVADHHCCRAQRKPRGSRISGCEPRGCGVGHHKNHLGH